MKRVIKSRDDGEMKTAAHCRMSTVVRAERQIIAFQAGFLKPVSQIVHRFAGGLAAS